MLTKVILMEDTTVLVNAWTNNSMKVADIISCSFMDLGKVYVLMVFITYWQPAQVFPLVCGEFAGCSVCLLFEGALVSFPQLKHFAINSADCGLLFVGMEVSTKVN